MVVEESPKKVGIFYSSGCMASVGALSVTASLEAFMRMQNNDVGLFCLSAIANEVPKHRKTTEDAENVISIDGCGNKCTTNILKKHGIIPDIEYNLVLDHHLRKIGPFKPFDYTEEEFEATVNKIIEICESCLEDE